MKLQSYQGKHGVQIFEFVTASLDLHSVTLTEFLYLVGALNSRYIDWASSSEYFFTIRIFL